MVGAVLLAAGSGKRMQGEVTDKLLHPIGHSNAFLLCLLTFHQTEEVDFIVIVYKDDDQLVKLRQCVIENHQFKQSQFLWIQGGQERQNSVWAGLNKLPKEVTHALIHDCARPFIRSTTISLAASEIKKGIAVTVARPLKDTLRLRTQNYQNPLEPAPTQTLDRKNHWLMETPQGAPKDWLIKGLAKARDQQILVTDDMAAIELIGYPIAMLEPNYPNPKITTPEDFSYAEFLLQE